jgi:ABC-2 type transport system ATP-binding protein
MMTAVIEVTGLTKRYGGHAVVDDIAFHVDAGEIFGILGPNGAGKTTAVECMEGLRRRDGGQVRILGLDPLTDRHRLHQRIGARWRGRPPTAGRRLTGPRPCTRTWC